MYVKHITGGKNRDDMSMENKRKNESMMSLKIFKSVLPSPSHYNMPSKREIARKSIVPILSRSHQFVLVLSGPIISKEMVSTKVSMARTVNELLLLKFSP